MPKKEKQRRFRKIVIAGKTRVSSLRESFRRNLKSKRNSMTIARSFLSLAALLGIMPVTSFQSQKPADECQDVQKHIKKEQDRFKGTITIRLDEMLLSEKFLQDEKLTLQIEVTYSNEKQSKPKDVKLIFKSQAPRLRLYQGEEAIFLADGKRIRSISAVNDVADQYGMSTRFEKKNVIVEYEDFVRIADAESVEMQLGAVEIKFDKKVLKALHGFISCGFQNVRN
jgi:hypothetical protein